MTVSAKALVQDQCPLALPEIFPAASLSHGQNSLDVE